MKTLPFALAGSALLLATLSAPVLAAPAIENAGGTVLDVSTDDREMNAAIAKARDTLPEFLAALAHPDGRTAFSFKYPLAGWEHIWVDGVKRRGNTLAGRLANDPLEPGHVIGEKVVVPLAAVSDWAYRDAVGVMHGHVTTRVMLPRINPDEAAQIREAFGWADSSKVVRRPQASP